MIILYHLLCILIGFALAWSEDHCGAAAATREIYIPRFFLYPLTNIGGHQQILESLILWKYRQRQERNIHTAIYIYLDLYS